MRPTLMVTPQVSLDSVAGAQGPLAAIHAHGWQSS
jgi:hypothetical protein